MKFDRRQGETNSLDLMTCVQRLEYDFDKQAGSLWMPEGCCWDMSGCFRLLQAIDEDVRMIYVYSVSAEDGHERWDYLLIRSSSGISACWQVGW